MLEKKKINSVLQDWPFYNIIGHCGLVAQLGERRVRNAEVESSSLFGSILKTCAISAEEARHSPEVEALGSNPRWHV